MQAVLTEHGAKAAEGLRSFWDQVKNETLDQSKLPDTLTSFVITGKRVRTDRDIKKLFVGKEQAGSITRDASALTVKIKTAALSSEKEVKLRDFVQALLVEPD